MAVETLYGSLIATPVYNTVPKEKADGAIQSGRLRRVVDTVEASAGASQTSKYYLGDIPSNAVIDPDLSKLHFDDLTATGAPTLDIGVEEADGTVHDTALGNGADCTSAGSVSVGASDIADYGKAVWELAGLSSDPGGLMKMYVTVQDAAVDTGGTITLRVVYAGK